MHASWALPVGRLSQIFKHLLFWLLQDSAGREIMSWLNAAGRVGGAGWAWTVPARSKLKNSAPKDEATVWLIVISQVK